MKKLMLIVTALTMSSVIFAQGNTQAPAVKQSDPAAKPAPAVQTAKPAAGNQTATPKTAPHAATATQAPAAETKKMEAAPVKHEVKKVSNAKQTHHATPVKKSEEKPAEKAPETK